MQDHEYLPSLTRKLGPLLLFTFRISAPLLLFRFHSLPLWPLPPHSAALPASLYNAMDSPVVTQLFRQLFRHQRCRYLGTSWATRKLGPSCPPTASYQQCRSLTKKASPRRRRTSDEEPWRQRMDHFPRDVSTEMREYPLVNAGDLRSRRERPRKVKMLTRDFIEGEQR